MTMPTDDPKTSKSGVPVSELSAHTSEWLERLAKSDEPLVITQDGEPAGVLLSPSLFERISKQARFITAIDEGLADSEAGRYLERDAAVADVKERTRRRLGE